MPSVSSTVPYMYAGMRWGLQYTVLLLKLQPSLIPSLLTSGHNRTNQRSTVPANHQASPPHHNPARGSACYLCHTLQDTNCQRISPHSLSLFLSLYIQ